MTIHPKTLAFAKKLYKKGSGIKAINAAIKERFGRGLFMPVLARALNGKGSVPGKSKGMREAKRRDVTSLSPRFFLAGKSGAKKGKVTLLPQSEVDRQCLSNRAITVGTNASKVIARGDSLVGANIEPLSNPLGAGKYLVIQGGEVIARFKEQKAAIAVAAEVSFEEAGAPVEIAHVRNTISVALDGDDKI